MGAVIKVGEPGAARLRGHVFTPQPTLTDCRAGATHAQHHELEREVAALTTALAQRDCAIGQLKARMDSALVEAEASGRVAGRQEAEDRQAARLVALELGIGQAVETYQAELASMERLGALLAKEAVAKVLGPDAHFPPLVARIVQKQVAALDGSSQIQVTVAQCDFADPERLDELAASSGRPGVAIETSPGLAAGDCRIRLRLGALEVGVAQQWAQLSAMLSELAEPDAAG